MKSMNVLLVLLVLLNAGLSVQAQNQGNRIVFKGSIVDGPFARNTINGFCTINMHHDNYQQTTRCVVKFDNGYKIVDQQASIKVIGSNRALRIILGPSMNGATLKGNFKSSSFQVTTYFDREIALSDIPDHFLAVEASIGGVSITGGTTSSNPDCLIWDIAGDGVFN